MINYEQELQKAHQHIEILNLEKNALKKMMQKFLDRNQENSFNSNHEDEMILNQLNKSQSQNYLQNQGSIEVKTLPKQNSKNYYRFQNDLQNKIDTFQNTAMLEDEAESEKIGSSNNVTRNIRQLKSYQSVNNINNSSNELQNQIQAQCIMVTNLQQKLQQYQRDLLAAQQNQSNLLNQLTSERQINLEYKSNIQNLMNQLNQLKNQISLLQENNLQHKNKLQEYQSQTNKNEQIKKHVSELNKQFEDLQEKLNQIEQEKDEYKTQLEKKSIQINTIQQINKNLKGNLEQLQSKIQQQEAILAEFQSKAEVEKQTIYFIKELEVQRKIFQQFIAQRKNKNLQSLFIKNFFNKESFENLFTDPQNYPDLLLKLLRFNIDILALFYEQEQIRPSSSQGIGANGINNLLFGSSSNNNQSSPSPQQLFLQGNPVTNISIIEDEGTTKNKASRVTKFSSQNNLLSAQMQGQLQPSLYQQELLQQFQQQQLIAFQDQIKQGKKEEMESEQQNQLQQQNGILQQYSKQNNQNQYLKAQQQLQQQEIFDRKQSLEPFNYENQNIGNFSQSHIKNNIQIANEATSNKQVGLENRMIDDSDHLNSQAFQQYLLKNSHSLQNASESIDQNNKNMIQQFLIEKQENQDDLRRSNNIQGNQPMSYQNTAQQISKNYQYSTPNQFVKSGYSSPTQVLFSEPQFSAVNQYKQGLNNNISSSFNPNLSNSLSQQQASYVNNQQMNQKQQSQMQTNDINQYFEQSQSIQDQQQSKDQKLQLNEALKTQDDQQNQKGLLSSKSTSLLNKQQIPDKSTSQKKQSTVNNTKTATKSPLRTQKSIKGDASTPKISNTTSPKVNNTSYNGILKKSQSIQDVKNNSTIANKSYDSKRVDTSSTMKTLGTGGSYLVENEEKKQKVQIQTQIQAVKQKHISDLDDLDKQLEMMKAEEEAEELRRQQQQLLNGKKQ
ncbi:hypothetical protein TTHERM_00136190 (macronuclear) [Tetrahymena thermophila SB210]|uniref:Uncharacterized protein n=1 Tax=Tetrahymena thermophila (strain SB210) TaxID=312017 RepID=I7MF76_TETTS|nr:hypothetical protein TTHERM_00136190 [Tetrahymena thermophila SB210]EAR99455.2 hypothetical protein TTHERM_00136190 [Tetrahymena thermophila SB210]|eukprot:XP_001019700.2 hypothetical protein TTHERM_00136190 [Tetrahymena thermophila SB210]